MKLLTVVGARPQFVKAAPVSRAVRVRHTEVLVHTGQHYDDALSAVFFRELGIPEPDAHLGVGSGDPGPRSAGMIRGIRREIGRHRPDLLLVYGDTDSTLAGALAAREEGVPIAHVEAGLRSHNLRMPEEVNRICTDHISSLLLCPTAGAAERLREERASGRIEWVGDVMLDVCLEAAERGRSMDVPGRFGLAGAGYYASTLHRAENTDDASRLAAIVEALDSLGLPVVLACHPRTRKALERFGLLRALHGLRVVDPLPYAEMLGLVAASRALLTDSGGLQKESMFLGVPCVTLRGETEWTETVEAGWNRLVGADTARIRSAVENLTVPQAGPDLEAFGGGRAAANVVAALERFVDPVL